MAQFFIHRHTCQRVHVYFKVKPSDRGDIYGIYCTIKKALDKINY